MRALLLFLVAFPAVACAPERPAAARRAQLAGGEERDEPIALLAAGEPVRASTIVEGVDGLAPWARARYASVERRQELLGPWALFELVADDAERQGLGDDPAVYAAMRDEMARQKARAAIAGRTKSPDEAAIESAYEASRARLTPEPGRHIAAVSVRTEAFARRILSALPPERSARALAQAARTFSVSEALGPEPQWLSPPEAYPPSSLERELAERAWSTEEGRTTEPVEFDGIWYVLGVLKAREAEPPPLAEVSARLRDEIMSERRAEARRAWLDELRADINR